MKITYDQYKEELTIDGEHSLTLAKGFAALTMDSDVLEYPNKVIVQNFTILGPTGSFWQKVKNTWLIVKYYWKKP